MFYYDATKRNRLIDQPPSRRVHHDRTADTTLRWRVGSLEQQVSGLTQKLNQLEQTLLRQAVPFGGMAVSSVLPEPVWMDQRKAAIETAAKQAGCIVRATADKDIVHFHHADGRFACQVLVRCRKGKAPVFNISTQTDGGNFPGDELVNEKHDALLVLMHDDRNITRAVLFQLNGTVRPYLMSALAAGVLKEKHGKGKSRYLELPVDFPGLLVLWDSDVHPADGKPRAGCLPMPRAVA